MVVIRTRRLVTAALSASRRCRRAAQPHTSAPTVGVYTQPRWSVGAARIVDHRRFLCSTGNNSTETDRAELANAANDADAEEEQVVTPKNEQDAQFLRALGHYHSLEGNFFVPTDFVVPSNDATWPQDVWGLSLGLRLRNFARGISNLYKRSLLKSVGFPYDDWKTYVWEEQMIPSLRMFKELEGHTFVRFPYVVPVGDSRFPKCAWGYKLGVAVALIRQQRESLSPEQVEQLNSMEFIWTENHYKLKVLFEPAMRRFIEIFRHSEVPTKFVVPEGADERLWPKKLHDTKLGYLYNCLKTGSFDEDTLADCPECRDQLGVFDTGVATQVWQEIVLPAMGTFVKVHGHTEIPTDFTIPHQDPWPQACWGYELGYVVQCVLNEGVFAEQLAGSKAELRSYGYRWNVLFGRWSRQLLPGLRCYRDMYGHSDVPPTFIVPDEDPWPEEARKYHLGRQLQLVRKFGRDSAEVADALEELDALDFKFNVVESDFKHKILPALHAYSAKYGHCDVPRGFVVPHDDSWPEKTWGLKLGGAASAIRARKQYRRQVDEYRDELKALGFSWSMPQTTTAVDREVVQPCLAIYRELYGADAIPEPDFVVPSNDNRWPVEASGFKLGRWLQTHSRRRRLTTDRGDSSSSDPGSSAPTPAMKRSQKRAPSLTPHQEQYWNEVLMASFEAYAQCFGSCREIDDNYVVPSEPPFPKIAWGLNLGLRVRYVRHHDRYAAEVDKYREQLETLHVIEPLTKV